jgi:UV DNA damage repair endonuclease
MGEAGDLANKYGQRLTTHPGPFNKLASPKEKVVLSTITDLEIHGKMLDLLKQPRSPHAKINIHVGAAYGDKPMALGNFNRNFERLSDAVKTRLTVENFMRKSTDRSVFLLSLTIITTSFVTAILENKMRSHLRSRRGEKQSQ